MYYTKYRPQKFSEISKPNEVAEALSTQVKNQKLSHAYLFVGPRGTGKTTTARILAKALNCANMGQNGDPCGECDTCLGIQTGNFLDLIEIDAASNRGIDDIRELRDKIKLAPSSAKKKVYIIDEVHMLTNEAFNALLKTLEEPPAHAVFILCTTESHKVPDTIKSRCQVFKFKRASVDQIVAKLEGIVKEENPSTKPQKEVLEKIARASLGGFRDAETLLQQVIEGEVDAESFIGLSSKEDIVDFVTALIEKDTNSALRKINSVFDDGIDLYTWSLEVLKYLRDLLFISAGAAEGLIDATAETQKEMEKQAKSLAPAKIAEYINAFAAAQSEIKSSSITQLPLEVAVVKICGGGRSQNLGEDGNATPIDPESGPDDAEEMELASASIELELDLDAEEASAAPPQPEMKGSRDTILISTIDNILSAWEDVLTALLAYNHGLSALLKTARPLSLSDGRLVLEVSYKFHKERLESSKNRELVESAIQEVLGEQIPITCQVSEHQPKLKSFESGDLTDLNIVSPSTQFSGKIIDVFDGALPL